MSIGEVFIKAGLAAAGAYGTTKAAQAIGSSLAREANSPLDIAISAMKKGWASGVGQNYVTATKGVRVEPYVLVDSRFVRLPYAKDVMNVSQRLWSAYYMLAVNSENTINGVKVSRRLDKFAPDRDLGEATIRFLSNESYHFGLPFVGEAAGLERYSSFSAESRPVTLISNEAGEPRTGSGVSVAAAKPVDVQNLAIGQIMDITFSDGAHSGTIQVMLRLKPIGMDPSVLLEILALGGIDQSYDARKFRFRMGDLSGMADLIQNKDRVRSYRQTLLKDKSGYFRKVHARQNRSWIATLLTGQPSLAQASSIAIITRDTARELEDKISGRLSDYETRQRIFEDSLLMLLLVVDDDTETVTVFTQDTEDHGVYTIDDIKASGKSGNSNGDLTDIMRSYLEGKVPGRL